MKSLDQLNLFHETGEIVICNLKFIKKLEFMKKIFKFSLVTKGGEAVGGSTIQNSIIYSV